MNDVMQNRALNGAKRRFTQKQLISQLLDQSFDLAQLCKDIQDLNDVERFVNELGEHIVKTGTTMEILMRKNPNISKACQEKLKEYLKELSNQAKIICHICGMDGFEDQADLDIHLEDCEEINQ